MLQLYYFREIKETKSIGNPVYDSDRESDFSSRVKSIVGWQATQKLNFNNTIR